MKEFLNVVGIFIVVVGMILIAGWVVALSWNIFMPYLFGFKAINFGHGLAILVFSSLILPRNYQKDK